MQTEKITALYARFSHDENTLGDSNSVANQKKLLVEYADSHGFTNCRTYADDGYTGVNFERPDFKRLMNDIENGLVGTVIVKDLSRLGRNYLMVGQYTEMVFPSYGVRFIAINDNVDSAEGSNELMPFSNLMNEWYSRDISKKIKASVNQRGRSGKRLTTKPIYGYKRDPENKDNWIIDEYAADVVRKVFKLYLDGYGVTAISEILRDEKIPKPNMYLEYYKHEENEIREYQYEWGGTTITSFIRRREYCGDTVNFRTRRLSYKNKKIIINPPEEQLIFENTHPAIIDRETFEKAQEIYNSRHRKHSSPDRSSVFSGYLFCLDCKARLHIHRNKRPKKVKVSFECTSYRKRIKHNPCFYHTITFLELNAYVTEQLIRLFYLANYDMTALKAMADSSCSKAETTALKNVREELESAQNRIAEINKYIQGLFEAKVRGEIDSELFGNLSKTYTDEKKSLNSRIAELLTAELHLKEENKKVHRFYSALAKHGDFHELTHELMRDLINRIEIGAAAINPETKQKTRRIDIYYVGVGLLRFD